MDKMLLNYLCCPKCYGNLRLKVIETHRDEVVEGELSCTSCGRMYKIKQGVPRLIINECFKPSNKLQQTFYDFYAPFYDRVERSLAMLLGFHEEELHNTVVSAMEIERCDRILEICIGTGSNVPYYRKYTNGLIVGVDISEEMLRKCLKKAKEHKWRRVELIQGCAEYLPLKSNIFDRVLIGGAISYFSNPKRALEETGRVAKPLAKVVIYE